MVVSSSFTRAHGSKRRRYVRAYPRRVSIPGTWISSVPTGRFCSRRAPRKRIRKKLAGFECVKPVAVHVSCSPAQLSCAAAAEPSSLSLPHSAPRRQRASRTAAGGSRRTWPGSPVPTPPRRGPRRRGGPGRPATWPLTRDPRAARPGRRWAPPAVKSVTPGLIQGPVGGGAHGAATPTCDVEVVCMPSFLRPALELDGWMTPSWLPVGPRPRQVNGQRHATDPLLLSCARTLRSGRRQVHRRDDREREGTPMRTRHARRRRLAREGRRGWGLDSRRTGSSSAAPNVSAHVGGDQGRAVPCARAQRPNALEWQVARAASRACTSTIRRS